MTTDISVSSSSLYNFETDSSSSYISSSHTDHSYVLQPRQTSESRVFVGHLGLPREFQGTHGTAGRTNGFSKNVDNRPHPFYDSTNGTRDKKTESKGYNTLRRRFTCKKVSTTQDAFQKEP